MPSPRSPVDPPRVRTGGCIPCMGRRTRPTTADAAYCAEKSSPNKNGDADEHARILVALVLDRLELGHCVGVRDTNDSVRDRVVARDGRDLVRMVARHRSSFEEEERHRPCGCGDLAMSHKKRTAFGDVYRAECNRCACSQFQIEPPRPKTATQLMLEKQDLKWLDTERVKVARRIAADRRLLADIDAAMATKE